MNLAGAQPRVIWYAPQHVEGESIGGASIFDLIPDRVTWIVLQLCLSCCCSRCGRAAGSARWSPSDLPVVVRASETVEGRGRLYRSRRARDRAADALRTATLQRMLPRLGLGPNADPAAVVAGRRRPRSAASRGRVGIRLFGPPPATDADLVNLARALDDIERQVAQS